MNEWETHILSNACNASMSKEFSGGDDRGMHSQDDDDCMPKMPRAI